MANTTHAMMEQVVKMFIATNFATSKDFMAGNPAVMTNQIFQLLHPGERVADKSFASEFAMIRHNLFEQRDILRGEMLNISDWPKNDKWRIVQRSVGSPPPFKPSDLKGNFYTKYDPSQKKLEQPPPPPKKKINPISLIMEAFEDMSHMFLATNFDSDQEVKDCDMKELVDNFERVMGKIMPGMSDELVGIRRTILEIEWCKIKAGQISIKGMEKNEKLGLHYNQNPPMFSISEEVSWRMCVMAHLTTAVFLITK